MAADSWFTYDFDGWFSKIVPPESGAGIKAAPSSRHPSGLVLVHQTVHYCILQTADGRFGSPGLRWQLKSATFRWGVQWENYLYRNRVPPSTPYLITRGYLDSRKSSEFHALMPGGLASGKVIPMLNMIIARHSGHPNFWHNLVSVDSKFFHELSMCSFSSSGVNSIPFHQMSGLKLCMSVFRNGQS